MDATSPEPKKNIFEQFANAVTKWTGSSSAFILAGLTIVVWGATGPVFHYSETWQLVINTGTTIITFLMVFLIQKSQNKESKAIQLKLNELIAANRFTSNRMVDVEELTEDELDELRAFYTRVSKLAEKDGDIHQSHSIDKAESLEKKKREIRKATTKNNEKNTHESSTGHKTDGL